MQGTSQTLNEELSRHEPTAGRSTAETHSADAARDWHAVLSVQERVQIPHKQARALPQDSLLSHAVKKWVSPPVELSFGSVAQLLKAHSTAPSARAKQRPLRRGSFFMIGLPIAFSDKTLPCIDHYAGVSFGDLVLAIESLDLFAQIAEFSANPSERPVNLVR